MTAPSGNAPSGSAASWNHLDRLSALIAHARAAGAAAADMWTRKSTASSVAASHTRNVPWSEADSMRVPSGEKAPSIWAARFPARQVIGEAQPCPRQHPKAIVPPAMAPYRLGRILDEVLTEAYRASYPSD